MTEPESRTPGLHRPRAARGGLGHLVPSPQEVAASQTPHEALGGRGNSQDFTSGGGYSFPSLSKLKARPCWCSDTTVGLGSPRAGAGKDTSKRPCLPRGASAVPAESLWLSPADTDWAPSWTGLRARCGSNTQPGSSSHEWGHSGMSLSFGLVAPWVTPGCDISGQSAPHLNPISRWDPTCFLHSLTPNAPQTHPELSPVPLSTPSEKKGDGKCW